MLGVEVRHELLVLLSSLQVGHVVVRRGRTAAVVRVQDRGSHFRELHDGWGAQGGQVECIGNWCDRECDKESDDV
jgi:hypothetical protein